MRVVTSFALSLSEKCVYFAPVLNDNLVEFKTRGYFPLILGKYFSVILGLRFFLLLGYSILRSKIVFLHEYLVFSGFLVWFGFCCCYFFLIRCSIGSLPYV